MRGIIGAAKTSWTLVLTWVLLHLGLAGCEDTTASQIAAKAEAGVACSIASECLSGVCTDGLCAMLADTLPTAVISGYAVTSVGVPVTMDGSLSTDPEGNPLGFAWSLRSKPAASQLKLEQTDRSTLTLTPDQPGVYEVALVVYNADEESQPARGLIFALNDDGAFPLQPDGGPCDEAAQCVSGKCDGTVCLPNAPPEAHAGVWATVAVGDLHTFDASLSNDPDGDPLSFYWRLLQLPEGSQAALDSTEGTTTLLTPDVPGVYVAELTVNDGVFNALATVGVLAVEAETLLLDDGDPCDTDAECRSGFCFQQVCATNQPPTAVISAPATVTAGEMVTLDGSDSSDPEMASLSFTWTLLGMPEGSGANIAATDDATPSFTADVAGTYVIELSVWDGELTSDPAVVVVEAFEPELLTDGTPCTGNSQCASGFCHQGTCVTNQAPLAVLDVPESAFTGDSITLDASGSSDPEGLELIFTWTLLHAPAGSSAALTDTTDPFNALEPDLPGLYGIRVDVTDPQGASAQAFAAFVASSPSPGANGAPCLSPADCESGFCFNAVCATNQAPIADAGDGQTIPFGTLATLNGSDSSDVEQMPLTYAWTFTLRPAGSAAELNDPTLAVPAFLPDIPGLYTLSLVVNDGLLSSLPASVAVYVSDPTQLANGQPCGDDLECASEFCNVGVCEINDPPVAVAGAFQSSPVADTVTLDGSESFDPEGAPLVFSWELIGAPEGATSSLADSASEEVSFEPDVPGIYTFVLTVNDGVLDSLPSTTTVSVGLGEPGDSCDSAADCASAYCDGSSVCAVNQLPVAVSGDPQNVTTLDTVSLDGSASFDFEGAVLTYAWALMDSPAGSAATLATPTEVTASFVADLPGNYTLQLVVNDGFQDSAPSYTVVVASFPDGEPDGATCNQDEGCASGYCYNDTCKTNEPPIADAGDDLSGFIGETIIADGTASSDPEGVSLTYAWTLAQKPVGSVAQLAGATTATPELIADVEGLYGLQLIVSDGRDTSVADYMLISATPAPVPGPVDICETITEDTLWVAATIYRITCPMAVTSGATLTIEPGTEIRMASQSGLTTNNLGAIDATGTAEKPIRFIQDAPATTWRGLRFSAGSNGPNIRLQHVDVAYGGTAWNVTSRHAGVVFEDIEGFTFDNVRVAQSSGVGVALLGTANPGVWDAITVEASGGAPVETTVRLAGRIGPGSYASANPLTNYIQLYTTGGTINTSMTWSDRGIPYYLPIGGASPTVGFEGTVESPAIWTIEDGVEIEMGDDLSWHFRSHSGLRALGDSQGIVVRPRGTNPWRQILFEGAMGSAIEIRNTHFSGGGRVPAPAAIRLSDVLEPIIFEDNIVSEHLNIALYLQETPGLVDGTDHRVDRNRFFGNASYPIAVTPRFVGTVGGNNVYTDVSGGAPNVQQRILVAGGATAFDNRIEQDATWQAHAIPYYVSDRITVKAPTGEPPAVLTLLPGLTAVFGFTNLVVDVNGALNAVGTAQDPITLSGLDGAVWGGVYFNGCEGALTVLQHLAVLNGGGAGATVSPAAALFFNNCGPDVRIDDVIVEDGPNYGIMFSGSQVAPGSFTGNRVSDMDKAFLRFDLPDLVNLPDGPYDPQIHGSFDVGSNPSTKHIEIIAPALLFSTAKMVDLGIPYRLLGAVSIETFDPLSPGRLEVDPNVTMYLTGGTQFAGIVVKNGGQLDIAGELGQEVRMSKWSSTGFITGVRVAFDADWDNVSVRHLNIRWGGFVDYIGVGTAASLGLSGAAGGTFEYITLEDAGGAFGVQFMDSVACPNMTNMSLQAPNGVGTECGATGTGPDCCAAAGL